VKHTPVVVPRRPRGAAILWALHAYAGLRTWAALGLGFFAVFEESEHRP
jgi:hypothetical protein